LLVVVGCCWKMLEGAGRCRKVLGADGRCW
jgi:hypothetical protein